MSKLGHYNGDLVFSFKNGKFMGTHSVNHASGGGHHHGHGGGHGGVKGLPPHNTHDSKAKLKSAKHYPGDLNKPVAIGAHGQGFISQGGGGGHHGGAAAHSGPPKHLGGASAAAGGSDVKAIYEAAMKKAMGKSGISGSTDIGPYKVAHHHPKPAAHSGGHHGAGWFANMAGGAPPPGHGGHPSLHASHLKPTAAMRKMHLAKHLGDHHDHKAKAKEHGDKNLAGGKPQKPVMHLPKHLGSGVPPPPPSKLAGGLAGGGKTSKKDFVLSDKEFTDGMTDASKVDPKSLGAGFWHVKSKEANPKHLKGYHAKSHHKEMVDPKSVPLPPAPNAKLPPPPSLEAPHGGGDMDLPS